MFEHTSRYYALETVALTLPDGRKVRYVRRRFLPRAEEMITRAEVTVGEGDRLDLITFRSLGEAEQFWRVCDANNAINPVDLTAEMGRKLRIATAEA